MAIAKIQSGEKPIFRMRIACSTAAAHRRKRLRNEKIAPVSHASPGTQPPPIQDVVPATKMRELQFDCRALLCVSRTQISSSRFFPAFVSEPHICSKVPPSLTLAPCRIPLSDRQIPPHRRAVPSPASFPYLRALPAENILSDQKSGQRP